MSSQDFSGRALQWLKACSLGEQALGVQVGKHVGDVVDVRAHLAGYPQAFAAGEFP